MSHLAMNFSNESKEKHENKSLKSTFRRNETNIRYYI